MKTELERLRQENQLLRNAFNSDFDLDAWLDWKMQVKELIKETKYNECLSCAEDAEALGAQNVADYLRNYAENRLIVTLDTPLKTT